MDSILKRKKSKIIASIHGTCVLPRKGRYVMVKNRYREFLYLWSIFTMPNGDGCTVLLAYPQELKEKGRERYGEIYFK